MTIHPTELEPPSRIRRGVVLAVPLAVVVGLFGISFGVVAASTPDVGGLAALVMSATTFAGSAEFAAISVLAGGGQPISAILAAVLLNLRYLAIGTSVAGSMQGGPLRRFLLAQLIVDESWAISARPGGRFEIRLLVGAGVLLWLAWVRLMTPMSRGGNGRPPMTTGPAALMPMVAAAMSATEIQPAGVPISGGRVR